MSPGQNTLKEMLTRHFCKFFYHWDDHFAYVMWDFVQCPEPHPYYNLRTTSICVFWLGDGLCWRGMVYVGGGRFMLEREVDQHLFQTRFLIGWENNRDGDITMPLYLKKIGSAGYKDQWNKKFDFVQVNRMLRVQSIALCNIHGCPTCF